LDMRAALGLLPSANNVRERISVWLCILFCVCVLLACKFVLVDVDIYHVDHKL